jgi:hypothetical protein
VLDLGVGVVAELLLLWVELRAEKRIFVTLHERHKGTTLVVITDSQRSEHLCQATIC